MSQQQHGLCFTHVIVLSIPQASTFVQTNTLVVAEDVAGVALAALHTGGWREVAEHGEEVRAGGGAGGGTV